MAAVIGSVCWAAATPRVWCRTVREAFARQVLSMGVASVGFVVLLALLAGISVVVQVQVWVQRIGQSQYLGPLLVVVVARELGPVLANFALIVRSGSTMTTELGIMKVSGEVRVLDAQGIDPFLVLVLPRVAGMMVAGLCLTMIFVWATFASGYLFGRIIGATGDEWSYFMHSVLVSVTPADLISLTAKSVISATLTATLCCTHGLGVGGTIGEVPDATRRALVQSFAALLLTSVGVSLLIYPAT